MSGLNPEQQAAVEHIGSPLLVLAGAGSGKTRVITQKIAWLIRNANISAKNIAAITFTNKASREMKERASQLLSKEEARGLTVATFHNLGLNIIRREYKALGYKPGFSILDAQDTSTIIKDLMLRDEDSPEPDDDFRWIISRWKNDFISPTKAFEQAMGAEVIISPVLAHFIDRDMDLVIAQANAAMFQTYMFHINGLGAGGNGRSLVVSPSGRILHQASVEEELIPIEVDFKKVRRQRERGLRNMGQPMKSFRDRPVDFPVYDRENFDATYLNSLGELKLPVRGE